MTGCYLLLIPTDERAWDAASAEEHERVFAGHEAFRAALTERDIRVMATKELAHSREGRVVRQLDGAVTVTDGPYAETVEQLGGLYLVEADDYDALCDAVGLLAGVEARVEIRPTG